MKPVHFTESYLINPTNPVSVDVVGCGGTGSQVLSGLARMDAALRALGHPGLSVRAYDPDAVGKENLGRQLFSPADVGKNKAVVHVTRINRFFGLGWEAVPTFFKPDSSSSHFNQMEKWSNIIITCVDTSKTRIEVSDFLKTYDPSLNRWGSNIPYYWLDFGNRKKSGQVVLGTISEIKQPASDSPVVSKLPTVIDMFPNIGSADTEESQGPSCSLAEALSRQDLFINSALAQIGVDILWKMFRELKIHFQGFFLNLNRFQCNPIPVKQTDSVS